MKSLKHCSLLIKKLFMRWVGLSHLLRTLRYVCFYLYLSVCICTCLIFRSCFSGDPWLMCPLSRNVQPKAQGAEVLGGRIGVCLGGVMLDAQGGGTRVTLQVFNCRWNRGVF